jgi:hypothetical protein
VTIQWNESGEISRFFQGVASRRSITIARVATLDKGMVVVEIKEMNPSRRYTIEGKPVA